MLPSHQSGPAQPSSPPPGLGWTVGLLTTLSPQISERERLYIYLLVFRVSTGTAWRPGAWLRPSCRRFRARRTPPTLTNIPGTRPSHRTNYPAGTRSSERLPPPTTLSINIILCPESFSNKINIFQHFELQLQLADKNITIQQQQVPSRWILSIRLISEDSCSEENRQSKDTKCW